MKPSIMVAILLAVVAIIIALIMSFSERIDFIYKSVGVLIGVVGAIVGCYTLYLNFIKAAIPSLLIGNKVLLIWHDNALRLNPMMDVFFTITNSGATQMYVDGIEIELTDEHRSKIIFTDYIFLKSINSMAYDPSLKKFLTNTSFMLDEYAHPFIVSKYSEKSLMIGLKSNNPQYIFEKGKYVLKAYLKWKGKIIADDQISFILSQEDIEQIILRKQRAQNEALEIKSIYDKL